MHSLVGHHQQSGLVPLVDEVKTELRREMDRLNKRIDLIDKQMSTILQLLSVNGGQEPVASQGHGGVTDNASTDKKTIRAVPSPSFMDTITEQEEDMNTSVETTADVGKQ